MRPVTTFKLLPLFIASLRLASAQEDGGISGPTTSPQAANYHCPADSCKLPNCNCASTNPPGGLKPQDTPQFVLFTADDAIQSYTLDSVNTFLAHRKNPNGCTPRMTYYTSLSYTNYSMVTEWYVAGNEIADHTMTHVGDPSADEINGNLIALNSLAGIPLSEIKGFRAPFLNYSAQTFTLLKNAGFQYDSSATSSIPATDPNTDAYWPYTLDYGLANDCLSVENICSGKPQIQGFWEVPMYGTFDEKGVAGPHLMDVYLDGSASDVMNWMKNTFNAHYNGNRQPFGIYTHPIHLAQNYPGVAPPAGAVQGMNDFLDWVQEQPNVWIVSVEQLLDWVRHPVPISQLGTVDALKCSVPQVSANICNGMPDKEQGLVQKCELPPDSYFSTCYGCPSAPPTPANPNPPQASGANRARIPANCSTPFWDPIGAKCLCTQSSCAFADTSKPIGPNGKNLTGSTGTAAGSSPTSDPFKPFSGVAPTLGDHSSTMWSVALGVVCAVIGGLGTLSVS